jgi:GGDEF domain-containing protein
MTDRDKGKNEQTVINRLEKEIKKANALKSREYKIMLSIGTINCDSKHNCSIDDLMTKADMLMYENKKEKKEAGNYNHS